jgi:hypothetical protein
MSDEEDQVRNAIDRAESSIGRSVVSAVDWLQEQNTETRIADAISRGRIDDAVADVDRAGDQIAQAVNDAFEDAMRNTASSISTAVDRRFHADSQNPSAVQAMRDNRLRIVREIVDEERTVLRTILTNGVQAGTNPIEIAREIRESIGLTSYQLQLVDNYRSALERQSVEALTRQLRDRRFDSTVRRAAAGERPLTKQQIDRMVGRYRERWVRFRAETIARTEALRAVHEGADEAFRQAIERGDLDAALLEATWHHHDPQKHPRSFHREMDGQQRAWGEPFTTGLGNQLLYPCDPSAPAEEVINCHCARSVRIRPRTAAIAA